MVPLHIQMTAGLSSVPNDPTAARIAGLMSKEEKFSSRVSLFQKYSSRLMSDSDLEGIDIMKRNNSVKETSDHVPKI